MSATRVTNGGPSAEGPGRSYAGAVPGRFSDACESSGSGGSMRVEERTDMGERYLVDVATGEKVIAGSRRPDGSYRKEIRVRPGYTPMALPRPTELGSNSSSVHGINTSPHYSTVEVEEFLCGGGGLAGSEYGSQFRAVAPKTGSTYLELTQAEERRVFQTRQQLSRSDRQGGSGGGIPGATFAPGYVPPGFSPAAANAAQRPGARASVPSSTKTRHRNRGANKERAPGTGGADGEAVEALCSDLQKMGVGGVSESPAGTQEGTQERSEIDTLRKKSRNLRKKLKDIEALETKGQAEPLTEEQLQKCARKGEVEEEIKKIDERLRGLEESEK
ncbi:mago binding protein [Cystoisospora suis]|uniref:Mago binding protein n=1 Tax=Cystoisospora suis TaxID=483139 RepID=A0A2C6KPC3_9APIC|nr:mago binding protein [Cystoisospora suis]